LKSSVSLERPLDPRGPVRAAFSAEASAMSRFQLGSAMLFINLFVAQAARVPWNAGAMRRLATGVGRDFTGLILGPPGGGKGTISKRLVRDFGFHHVSTGDLLRAEVRAGSELGKAAKAHMDSGTLVPDDLIVDMLMEELKRAKSNRVLLDGFPRTVAQADVLHQKGLPVSAAMNLAVPFDEIVKRTSGRWIHPASGRTYSYDFNPPKVPGKDDVTGEDLVQRDDDKPEVVRARLDTYQQQAEPLVEYYKSAGLLAHFDGEDQPDLVAQDRRSDAIYASLKPYLHQQLGEKPDGK